MSWFIEYKCAESEPQRFRLDQGHAVRIGRGSNSDTKIPDPALSRIHCEVVLEGIGPRIRDLDSSAGTYVGGQRVTEQVLKPGTTFRAGNTLFTVVSDSSLDAPTRMLASSTSGGQLAKLVESFQEKGKIDRFSIKRLVNRGGRNLVYQAEDPETGQDVAVKILPTDESTDEDEGRFMRAMKMLQQVRDPCIIKLFRAGRKKRYCWVAMEWLPAGSVADRTRDHGINGRLDWQDAWRIAFSISQSLHVLEREKIVHRNIRPTNILFRGAKEPYVLSDLIVAKAHDSTSQSKMITRQVFFPHDLAYTAPERLHGHDTSADSLQADIYSLGAVLTEVLTGEPPYGRGDLREMLTRLKGPRKTVHPEAQLGLNEMFLDLVNKMTQPDPSRRIESAIRLWQEVERVGKLAGLSGVS